MFTPIIHNLSANSAGYTEAQYYNQLISERPKGVGSLAAKIDALSTWKTTCRKALANAERALATKDIIEARLILANALIGKRVQFVKSPLIRTKEVVGVTHDGFVVLHKVLGVYNPEHLKIVETKKKEA